MKKYLFSKWVPHNTEPERSAIMQWIHDVLYKKYEEKVNQQAVPSHEFMDDLFRKAPEVRSHCYTGGNYEDGILDLYYDVAINAEDIVDGKPETIAYDILCHWRNEMQKAYNLDPAPFCKCLTARKAVFSIPLCIKGYKTLGKIQYDQRQAERKEVQKQADQEIRRAKALENQRNKR